MRNVFCKPGCACKEGYILDTITNKCFEEKACPCHHAEKIYKDGDVTKQDCKLWFVFEWLINFYDAFPQWCIHALHARWQFAQE
jgi:hypothetical protein